ncbi:MAG: MerR family transcriptional regulator [Bacteroidales bacterium]|jgi:DNA-binding transcriptional MerR regulator|nr:MerR family transcriptional regulator [Bacteroidales bacterium]
MIMEELSKQYYKIKEVAEILDVPQSTLRFWEKEFPMIKPIRSSHNIRYYRPQDIELLRIIHYLIKDKGLKIEAAREQLRSNKHNVSRRVEIIDRLKSVRSELANLLVALGGRKL